MNIHDLRKAQAVFESEIEAIMDRKSDLYKLREDFVTYFSLKGIQNMDIDGYVLGKEKPNTWFNFCYGLERQLKGLGWMIGGNSFKFGFYFGKTKSDKTRKYRYTKLFESTPAGALSTAKNLIEDLLEKGRQEDVRGIILNPLSPMFKGKILATYYPDRYLNVFASSHLNYFIGKLNLDVGDLLRQNEVIKRERLLEFKENDPVMRSWPIDIYSDFLYRLFGRPTDTKSKLSDPLQNYRPVNFPLNAKAEFVDLTFDSDSVDEAKDGERGRHQGKSNLKKDYEFEERRYRELGDRGEKFVVDIERQRLISLGRPDLAKKVDRVSQRSDSHGYDVLSYEADNSHRYIEVKATTRSVGPAEFFLTDNELKTALTTQNFFVYMVYDILSLQPKVWPIANPFKPVNPALKMRSIKYKCVLKTRN